MRDLHKKKTEAEPGSTSAFMRCWERVDKGGQKEKISKKKEERVSVVSEPLKEKRIAEEECGQQDPTQARTEVKISMRVGVRVICDTERQRPVRKQRPMAVAEPEQG